MPGYISEFQYYGNTSQEFIEIELPAGTDPAGYTVQIYMFDGSVFDAFPLGTSSGTMGGYDVYVIDASTPGFDDGGVDPTGNLYPDDALALVNSSGTVEQFVSYWGSTVTATEGPAAGQTSTDVGTAAMGESLQSDNAGASYFAQSAPNSGTIPACYAPGSLIATPDGPRCVEDICVGDEVIIANGASRTVSRTVRWVWSGCQPLEDLEPHQKPILIQAGALGLNRPSKDLIVSAQHRIVVGAYGQLEALFDRPRMVPAKALTHHRGIRFMLGKQSMNWHHFLCDEHSIVFANDLASETLLLGSTIVQSLSTVQRSKLSKALHRAITSTTCDQPVLQCLSVNEAACIIKQRNAFRSEMIPTAQSPAVLQSV